MKQFVLLVLFSYALMTDAQSHKAIFLHHSVGGAVFNDGNVNQWITDYNTQNATNYSVTEFEYPNDPWGWENYPYDYWKLWVDGACENTQDNIQCLDKLCQNYELIIFKHCFPGAGIEEDFSSGDVTSSDKTLPNYKLQYLALLDLFDQYPGNKFMIWTLAPLHRNATSPEQARRAAEFTDWVKNTWLTEDGNSHPNVTVFDFFGLAAEQSASLVNGIQYCLKYDYEGDHNGDDSHPNTLANQTIGPLFAEKIVKTLAGASSTSGGINVSSYLEVRYDESRQAIVYSIDGKMVRPPYLIEVYSVPGQRIKAIETAENAGSIALDQARGVFIIRVKTDRIYLSRKVMR